MEELKPSTSDRLLYRNQNFLSCSSQSACSDSFAVTLRKKKRQDLYSKKRHKDLQKPTAQMSSHPTLDLFQSIKQVLLFYSTGPELLEALKYLHNQYVPHNSLAFKLSKSLNIIQDLAGLLKSVPQASEEFKEALGCICNLASGPEYITEALFDLHIDDYCMTLVNCFDESLAETAIWCLSNLGADRQECREKIVRNGTLMMLIEKLRMSPRMQNTILWAIRNSIDRIPDLPEALLKNLLQIVKFQLKLKSKNSYKETLWIFSTLTDGNSNQLEKLIKGKCLNLVISALQSSKSKIVLPSLRSIGNIAAGTSKQAQVLLDKGILDSLYSVVDKFSHKFSVKKYIYWTLSNLASGIKSQIDLIVKHPILIKAVTSINDCDNRIRKEAIIIAKNIAKLGSMDSVRALVNVGIIKEAKQFLRDSLDFELIFMLLECIFEVISIFKASWKHEVICIVRNCEVDNEVEKLAREKNREVSGMALKIMKIMENSD